MFDTLNLWSTLNLNQWRKHNSKNSSENIRIDWLNHLAMNDSCNGHIPSSVGGHSETKKWPNSVVVEWGYEHSGGTTSSKYVCPSPLVQMIVYIVDITVKSHEHKLVHKKRVKSFVVLCVLAMHVLPTWSFLSLCFPTFSILGTAKFRQFATRITKPKTMFSFRKTETSGEFDGIWHRWPRSMTNDQKESNQN